MNQSSSMTGQQHKSESGGQAQLTLERQEELRDTFRLLGINADEKIDFGELKIFMEAQGLNVQEQNLVSLLQTGPVPSTSLCRLMRLLMASPQTTPNCDPRKALLQAFDCIDLGAKGKIDQVDLQRAAREWGQHLTKEELVAIIEEFDQDGDGAIDREDVLKIF